MVKVISIDEVADYIGLKVETIRNWSINGTSNPEYKIVKQWQFKCSEFCIRVSGGKMIWIDGIATLGRKKYAH